MILYHGTTCKRAQKIFEDKTIKKDCTRFFTEEENGSGYSTDGYIYLTNEITFALHFAYCHSLVDKSDVLVVFRIDIPDELILPDYDEMRHQDPTGIDQEQYNDDLSCSLLEFKACRIKIDISFDKYNVDYFYFDVNDVDNISDLFDNVGCNYEYAVSHYTRKQKEFIKAIQWMHTYNL